MSGTIEGVKPLTDRRSFLRRTVAAFAVGAAGTANVTAIAVTRPAAAAATERPEMIDAGRRLDALRSEWQAAQALRLEARALAESLVPPVPDEIILRGPPMPGVECQCDVEGKPKYREPRIYDSTALARAVDDGSIYAPKRTKFGKRMRGIIEIAKKYEAERVAVIERSGLNDHLERVYNAATGLQQIAREVAEIEPLTVAGAAIQARALCAYSDAEDSYDKGWAKLILGLPLAQSLARLTTAGVA
jgi:hypothetical protein